MVAELDTSTADRARAAYTRLLAVNDPATVAVARLHAPDAEYGEWDGATGQRQRLPWMTTLSTRQPGCEGCDPGAYAEDSAQWPCATLRVLGELHGIDLPEVWW